MGMQDRSLGPKTRAIHGAPPLDSGLGQPLSVPIAQTSTFGFESIEAMEHAISHPGTGYVYSRVMNPTVDAMERSVAELEHAEQAVGFASGMAAIHAAFLAELESGDHIVAPASLYGGAYALFTRLFPKMGIETTFIDDISPRAFRDAIRPTTKVIYAETISNPLVRVPNLTSLAELAAAHNVRLFVDSTLAGPVVARPLDMGADLVIHSASKYLGGHGDLIAGVVAGHNDLMQKVRQVAIDAGGVIAPFVAWLIIRGLKTLPLRMNQHQQSALAVAEFLAQHKKVQACIYPGLDHHPDHLLAKDALNGGFGAVVAFEVQGGDEVAAKVANTLKIFTRAGSLGDTHSLVVVPAATSHRPLSPEAREQAGIRPGLLRLSIGLEDAEDLIADLECALEQV